MSSTPDYPRPNARFHLSLFLGFGGQYEWAKTEDHRDYFDPEITLKFVQDAERGLFSTVLFGEAQRHFEHLGKLNDIRFTGRQDALVHFAFLAARTKNIGLAATLNTTYSKPVELARRLATVDLLSGGRGAWNVITTENPWIGGNFRKPGWLPNSARYTNAEEYVNGVQALWEAWPTDAVAHSTEAEAWSEGIGLVESHGEYQRFRAVPSVPPSPQPYPVYFQAGNSAEGRDFAARHAEALYTFQIDFDDAVAYSADIRARARSYGRPGDDIKVLPGASVILGDTEAEAQERAEHQQRLHLLNDRSIRQQVEDVWGIELPDLDLDGPLPETEPVITKQNLGHGIVHTGNDPQSVARGWRQRFEERGHRSVRELVAGFHSPRAFIGTPGQVADKLVHYLKSDALDGINYYPSDFPNGVAEITDRLVPELQERGVYPDSYAGTTLRENFGLPAVPAHIRVREELARRAGSENPAAIDAAESISIDDRVLQRTE
ncbi:LLM class flavin-dependent oxidoreductase [Mycetocola tolaasinivorans]|uniref:LLM class flavin-dependent oxidoreductase n=1 Tax=Mycetocola tolaasinivorans TaxID=76635 RepID=A0A3L7A4Q9_9MICO|nr:NtaA/DmoA family FMN-dependent monooxygenase [Mycetocola tolaasinivorans]RLP75279.1 LLM class flavin-dependent oxidoreductase [Mycetocola tolaasinivorans]